MRLPRLQKAHDPDTIQRRETFAAVERHRMSLQRVRDTLRSADETLADEIRRLDRIITHDSGIGI